DITVPGNEHHGTLQMQNLSTDTEDPTDGTIKNITQINPDKTSTRRCLPIVGMPSFTGSRFNVVIVLSFEMDYHWGRIEKEYRFKTIENVDGQLIWVPQSE